MWLIDKIKSLFRKSYEIYPNNPSDLISFVKVKNKTLKFGNEIIVKEGYKLVFVHYNKVYDILQGGTYKVDEAFAPKLYARVIMKQKKDVNSKNPNKISADLYLIKLDEIRLVSFKTTSKIIAHVNDTKVKFKVKGTFNFKVVDVEKFMNYFTGEFAFLRNKKVLRELSFIFSDEVTKKMKANNFNFNDYFLKRDEIEEKLRKDLEYLKEKFGIELSRIYINQIDVAKKFLGLKVLAEKQKKMEDDLITFTEERINKKIDNDNSLQEQNVEVLSRRDLLMKEIEQARKENEMKSNKDDFLEAKFSSNNDNFFDESIDMKKSNDESPHLFEEKNEDSLNERKKDDTYKKSEFVKSDDINFGETRFSGNSNLYSNSENYTNNINDNSISNSYETIKQPIPSIIDEIKLDKNGLKEEKVIIVEKKLLRCPCCGAKNFEDSNDCILCKRKL